MSSSGTIFLSIASLAFISLLIIVYFTKERVITSENKVFTKLIIISFITLLLLINTNLQPFLCGLSLNAFDIGNLNVFQKMYKLNIK